MADNKQGGASAVASTAVAVAKSVQTAVKIGRTIAGASSGAYTFGIGTVVTLVIEFRKPIGRAIAAIALIIAIPIVYICMLPTLIFGGLDKFPDIPVMNDNAAIYAYIEDVGVKVREVLNAEHTVILVAVQKEIDALPAGDEHEIIDSFNADSALDTNILISQYCAYKDNYEEISTNDLINTIKTHKDNLFLWSVATESREITRQTEVEVEKTVIEYVDSVVTDDKGNTRTVSVPVRKTIKVKEIQEEIVTVTMHTYTVSFTGADYFANEVFKLDDIKAELARNYAENLTLFLQDRDIIY